MKTITITAAKVATLGAVLMLAASAVLVANAAVNITSATINSGASATVYPGDSVTVDVSGSKDGEQCANNWTITRVTVEGVDSYDSVLNLTGSGSNGPISDSVSFTAPAPGNYVVTVEVIGGESGPTLTCPASVMDTWEAELSLEVLAPVDPYIQILSISPLVEERVVGDTNPLTYVAEVQVGGAPVSGNLQCVVFDIFGLGDGQQKVEVVGANTPEIYEVQYTYTDISGYALGEYPVVAIATDVACDSLPDDFSADYEGDASGAYSDADAVLHIVEPQPEFTVSIEITGDGSGTVTCLIEEVEQDCGGTFENGTELTLVATPDEGSNFDSSWTVGAGTCTGNTTPCSVTVTSNLNLVAHFALNSSNNNNSSSNSGGGGSRASGTRVGDRDNNNDTTDEEAPEGEVLGASTDEMPAGAPNTGAGSTAPIAVQLPSLVAVLSTARNSRN